MADDDKEKQKPTYEGAPFYGSGGSGDGGNGDYGDRGGHDEESDDVGGNAPSLPAPRVNGKSYGGDSPAPYNGDQGYQQEGRYGKFGRYQFNGYGRVPYQPMQGSSHLDILGRPLAQWWRRAVAYIIDIILIDIVSSILISLLFPGNLKTTKSGLPVFDAHFFMVYVFEMVVLLGYFALLDGSQRGQTVGKMAMGIATIDANTGGQLGAARALVRRFVFIVLFFIFVVPGIVNAVSPLWSRSWQEWNDYAGKSQVISIR